MDVSQLRTTQLSFPWRTWGKNVIVVSVGWAWLRNVARRECEEIRNFQFYNSNRAKILPIELFQIFGNCAGKTRWLELWRSSGLCRIAPIAKIQIYIDSGHIEDYSGFGYFRFIFYFPPVGSMSDLLLSFLCYATPSYSKMPTSNLTVLLGRQRSCYRKVWHIRSMRSHLIIR